MKFIFLITVFIISLLILSQRAHSISIDVKLYENWDIARHDETVWFVMTFNQGEVTKWYHLKVNNGTQDLPFQMWPVEYWEDESIRKAYIFTKWTIQANGTISYKITVDKTFTEPSYASNFIFTKGDPIYLESSKLKIAVTNKTNDYSRWSGIWDKINLNQNPIKNPVESIWNDDKNANWRRARNNDNFITFNNGPIFSNLTFYGFYSEDDEFHSRSYILFDNPPILWIVEKLKNKNSSFSQRTYQWRFLYFGRFNLSSDWIGTYPDFSWKNNISDNWDKNYLMGDLLQDKQEAIFVHTWLNSYVDLRNYFLNDSASNSHLLSNFRSTLFLLHPEEDVQAINIIGYALTNITAFDNVKKISSPSGYATTIDYNPLEFRQQALNNMKRWFNEGIYGRTRESFSPEIGFIEELALSTKVSLILWLTTQNATYGSQYLTLVSFLDYFMSNQYWETKGYVMPTAGNGKAHLFSRNSNSTHYEIGIEKDSIQETYDTLWFISRFNSERKEWAEEKMKEIVEYIINRHWNSTTRHFNVYALYDKNGNLISLSGGEGIWNMEAIAIQVIGYGYLLTKKQNYLDVINNWFENLLSKRTPEGNLLYGPTLGRYLFYNDGISSDLFSLQKMGLLNEIDVRKVILSSVFTEEKYNFWDHVGLRPEWGSHEREYFSDFRNNLERLENYTNIGSGQPLLRALSISELLGVSNGLSSYWKYSDSNKGYKWVVQWRTPYIIADLDSRDFDLNDDMNIYSFNSSSDSLKGLYIFNWNFNSTTKVLTVNVTYPTIKT